MRFRNTTDIPDQLIAIAVAFSIQQGVEIDEIVVKNKAEGKTHGQWGWYFSHNRKVVLIVPQVVTKLTGRQKYTRRPYYMTSRTEFLIAIMAHELRHAYQHQILKEHMGVANRARHELDAERYETQKLNDWRRQYGEVAAASRSR